MSLRLPTGGRTVFRFFFSGQGPEEEHGGKDGDKEAFRSRGHYRARQPGEAHVPLAVQDFPPQRAHGCELVAATMHIAV